MNKFIFISIFLFVFTTGKIFGQRDNSFKIIASMTGLGASYEFNPAGVIYTEGGITSSFTALRINLQSKLLMYQKEHFKIKFGVEGAYIYGNFDVGSIFINYNRFNNFIFMPVISFESKVIGVQIPVFVDRSFTYVFPIVGITLNVTKDDPAKRIKKDKSRKDFEKEQKEREKLLEKRKKEEEEL